jgi:hypothetical protein
MAALWNIYKVSVSTGGTSKEQLLLFTSWLVPFFFF